MKRNNRVRFILLGCLLFGFALTVSPLPPRSSHAATASCVELLRDGSFEAGGQGWVQYSAQGYELISDFNPRTGRLGAYLAGVNNANDRISQQVVLPPGTITLTLDAWWYLATAETAGVFDTMTVSLLRIDGTLLATLATVNNTAPVGVWDELALDLTSYAGQTAVIRFEARTDANNISDFYLDDVSVMACAADVTPTPTAPPTRTATATGPAGPTPTATATRAPTSSPTPSVTASPSSTASPTATPTGLFPSPTATGTTTLTPTATGTAIGGPTTTATMTATPVAATPAVTSSATWTATSTPPARTATSTPTFDPALKRQYLPLITYSGGLP